MDEPDVYERPVERTERFHLEPLATPAAFITLSSSRRYSPHHINEPLRRLRTRNDE